MGTGERRKQQGNGKGKFTEKQTVVGKIPSQNRNRVLDSLSHGENTMNVI